jgi:hypothetical protein
MSLSSRMTYPHSIEYIDPELSDPLFTCLPLSTRGPVFFFAGAWCADPLKQAGVPAVNVYWGPPSKSLGLGLITNRTVVVWPATCQEENLFAKKISAMLLRRNCRVKMINPTTLGLKDGEYVTKWLKKRSHLTKEELLREFRWLADSALEIPSLT